LHTPLLQKQANGVVRGKNLTTRRRFAIAERAKRRHHHGEEEE